MEESSGMENIVPGQGGSWSLGQSQAREDLLSSRHGSDSTSGAFRPVPQSQSVIGFLSGQASH